MVHFIVSLLIPERLAAAAALWRLARWVLQGVRGAGPRGVVDWIAVTAWSAVAAVWLSGQAAGIAISYIQWVNRLWLSVALEGQQANPGGLAHLAGFYAFEAGGELALALFTVKVWALESMDMVCATAAHVTMWVYGVRAAYGRLQKLS